MRRSTITISIQTLLQVLVIAGALFTWWIVHERDSQHDQDRIGTLEIHDRDLDKKNDAFDVRMENAEKIGDHLLLVSTQIARKLGIKDADLPPLPFLKQVPHVGATSFTNPPPWNITIDAAISKANLPYSAAQ